LLKTPQPFVILYECLQEFGFRNSQCKEMITAIAKNQSGKLWYSDSNEVLLDRDYFFIREKDNSKKIEIVIPKGIENITRHNFEIQIDSLFSKDHTIVKNEEIIVDKDKISFPLLLRPWQDGDFFCPAGMSGKRKKVKSFLTDLKQTRFEKEAVYVLESKGTIVWIISLRQDERFLPTESTENLLRIRIIDNIKR
jgi:tRNA(Ile)-lysidine synthase